jgi:hypothetical protein
MNDYFLAANLSAARTPDEERALTYSFLNWMVIATLIVCGTATALLFPLALAITFFWTPS